MLRALLPFQVDTQSVVDAQASPLAKPVTAVIHLFRMALFMALAGYFGAMVLRKRGARSYLRDRAMRILLPAIAFYPVAVISAGALTALLNGRSHPLRRSGSPTGTGPAPNPRPRRGPDERGTSGRRTDHRDHPVCIATPSIRSRPCGLRCAVG